MEIVHGKPDDGKLINIEGKKGESLFHHPVVWFIQKEFKRIKEQYEGYQKLIEGAKEERLLALIGALSMEEALDLFLGAYIPKYKRILKNTDFTLSMKIEIAHSLRLIPRHILNSADIVRKIRNEFAHDLSIHCFDSLDEKKFKTKLRARFKEFSHDDTNTSPTVKDMFISVVEIVIVGLGIYASHLRTAKEYIYSAEFSQQLVERIKAKSG